MADSFDPYYQWLGIEPVDQPPHHYRLLAIEPFLDNREIIAGAADRQMAHLRTFQRGPQATASQRLLNEVSIAKVCLLNPQKKTAYDEQLRKTLARGSGRSSRLLLIGSAAAIVVIALGATVWMLAGPSSDGEVAQRAVGGAGPTNQPAAPSKPDPDAATAPKEKETSDEDSKTPGAKDPPETNPPVATSPEQTGEPTEVPGDTRTDVASPSTAKTPGDDDQNKVPPEATTLPETGAPTDEKPSDANDSPPATQPGDTPRTAKLPIPDPAARQKARVEVKSAFKYDQATQRAARLRLAGEMIDEALQSDDERTAQFVMLDISRELGIRAGDVRTAFRAIGELDERFVIDALAMRVHTITQVLRGNLSALERKQVVRHGLVLVDELLLADQFQLGGRLTSQMGKAAKTLRDKTLSSAVDARRKRGSTLFKQYQKIEPAVLTLKTAPDDPQANLRVGTYRCFVQGNWQPGLALLARGSDAELRQVAESEIARPATAAQQKALADGWLALAEKNDDQQAAHEMKVRAATWYRSALEGLTGFARRRVEQQLEPLADLKSALPQVTAGVAPVGVVTAAAYVGPYEFFESDKRIIGAKPDATILLRKDGKVVQDGKPVATWRDDDGALIITYLDRARGTAQLKQKNRYELSGTRTSLDNERTKVGLRRVFVVAVWEDVHSGGKVIDRLVLYSNERVNDPLGEVAWSRSAKYLRIDKTQMYLQAGGQLFSGWREEEKSHYGRWLTDGILLDTRKTARRAAPPAVPPRLSAKEEKMLIATYEMIGAAKSDKRKVRLTVDLSKDGRLMDHDDEIGVWSHEGGRVTLRFIDPRLGLANMRLRNRSDLIGSSTGADKARWSWEFIRVKGIEKVINNKKVTLFNNGRLDDPHAGKGYWYLRKNKPVLLHNW